MGDRKFHHKFHEMANNENEHKGTTKAGCMTEYPIFIPAQAGRASEDIALQIEAAVIGGKIKPGEKLPSERELRIHFQTGRGVVREALHALKQKGLIETRKGTKGGAFARRIEAANVSEALALFFKQHHINPDYIIEFRECIDRAITSLAIARESEAGKAALVEGVAMLGEMLSEPEPDFDAVVELDRELNIRLAAMTKNPIFELLMRAIQLGFSSYDHALYYDSEYRKQIADNWKQTAVNIAKGEPLKALAHISHHYVMLRRCLETKKGGTDNPNGPFWEETETRTTGEATQKDENLK